MNPDKKFLRTARRHLDNAESKLLDGNNMTPPHHILNDAVGNIVNAFEGERYWLVEWEKLEVRFAGTNLYWALFNNHQRLTYPLDDTNYWRVVDLTTLTDIIREAWQSLESEEGILLDDLMLAVIDSASKRMTRVDLVVRDLIQARGK